MSPKHRAGLARRLAAASWGTKLALLIAADAITVVLATLLAITLRYDESAEGVRDHVGVLLLAPPTVILVFLSMGIHRIVVRYAGAAMATRLAIACGIAAILLAGATFIVDREGGQSRSVIINTAVFAFLGTWGLRIAAGRFLRTTNPEVPAVRVAIYGAGIAGAGLAKALHPDPTWRPVAFVDDNKRLHGMKVADLPVRPSEDLSSLVEEHGVEAIFLALPSVTPDARRRILDRLRPLGIRVLTVPTLAELVAGRADFRDLRHLDLEDLIGRRMVTADEHLLHRAIGDRTVLVTGGGGSIGSELCRQIIEVGPRRLVILDQSELNLYRIGVELEDASAEHGIDVRTVLGDICDGAMLEELFASERFDVVFHAAACKHVPIVEHHEPEGVRTNTLGTAAVLDAAVRHQVERFVLVSTDKAVRPTNVMGGSKRLAELAVQAQAAEIQARGEGPILCMVRFGNVIDSSGSVVPRFRAQIEAGGPVTVTHPDITRFFMTIPEASELVLQAASMARGGEVFLLDMGQPVRILDLARSMVELAGLTVRDDDRPDGDIEIRITGLRPGEKIHEELLIGETAERSEHPRIHRSREARLPTEETRTMLARVERAVVDRDREALRSLLVRYASLRPPQSTASPLSLDGIDAKTTTTPVEID